LLPSKVVQGHVSGLIHRGQAGGLARLHQVAGQLGLAVGRHHLAAGQAVHVDGVAYPAEHQLDAVVHRAPVVHARAHAGLVQQVHRDLLQDAGADAAQHIVATLALQDHVVDAGLVQQLAEQQAGRACADDGDLGSGGGHGASPLY
jgi:hypothetical protein